MFKSKYMSTRTNTAFKNNAPTIPNAVETAYADMSRHQYGHREEIKNQ